MERTPIFFYQRQTASAHASAARGGVLCVRGEKASDDFETFAKIHFSQLSPAAQKVCASLWPVSLLRNSIVALRWARTSTLRSCGEFFFSCNALRLSLASRWRFLLSLSLLHLSACLRPTPLPFSPPSFPRRRKKQSDGAPYCSHARLRASALRAARLPLRLRRLPIPPRLPPLPSPPPRAPVPSQCCASCCACARGSTGSCRRLRV